MNHAEQLTELIFFVTNNFGNDYFDDSSDTNKDLKYFGSWPTEVTKILKQIYHFAMKGMSEITRFKYFWTKTTMHVSSFI